MFKQMDQDIIQRNPETFSYWDERDCFDNISQQY
jgi:hypothetical protein